MNIQNYPKVYSKFKEFNRKLLDVWVKEAVGENMDEKELNPDYLDTVSDSVLSFNPRILYDFLDENKTYLSIYHNGLDGWRYEIQYDKGTEDCVDAYPNRKGAEEDGFNQAFKMLEEIL